VTYVVATNPANAETFDLVKILPQAKVRSERGLRGYSVLVTVPLDALGLDPKTAGGLKGVAGVIYSDPSGTNRAARLYWHAKDTGQISDVPSESRLSPAGWGKIQLGT
jgi:hypothetical protein